MPNKLPFVPKWFRKIRRPGGGPPVTLTHSEQLSIFRCPKAKFELYEQRLRAEREQPPAPALATARSDLGQWDTLDA